MKTALISVSDKTNLIDFASRLITLGFRIISTGGTAATLRSANVAVNYVSDITGFPEVLGGRVKTLHPAIHGGILADMNNAAHRQQLSDLGINKIDIVVVNLYPFESVLRRSHSTREELIENIDIGGPAMIRAAAKNYRSTLVVTDSADYTAVLDMLEEGSVGESERLNLAHKAFAHTAFYDSMISTWLSKETGLMFPTERGLALRMEQSLRYGENPHQRAALYGATRDIFTCLHGKELSYNNILDIDAALGMALEFQETMVGIFKHNNPCGVATGSTLTEAWEKAFATDAVSPFGGIVICNGEVDEAFASHIHSIFLEVLIAPSFTQGALDILTKKKDRRLVSASFDAARRSSTLQWRSVRGGILVQTVDNEAGTDDSYTVVTRRHPSHLELASMSLAWRVAAHVKSNAIVYTLADRTLAIGAGQMSRLDSVRIAAWKAQNAGLSLQGSAVASDAFFPFADGLLQAAAAGATCVIQPGGSVRDAEVIAAADEHGLAMVFTGRRHFRH